LSTILQNILTSYFLFGNSIIHSEFSLNSAAVPSINNFLSLILAISFIDFIFALSFHPYVNPLSFLLCKSPSSYKYSPTLLSINTGVALLGENLIFISFNVGTKHLVFGNFNPHLYTVSLLYDFTFPSYLTLTISPLIESTFPLI